MKDELGGQTMAKSVGLRSKMYNYLKDDGSGSKDVKGTKICLIKRELKFKEYTNCLEANRLKKINHLEKNNIEVDGLTENHKKL